MSTSTTEQQRYWNFNLYDIFSYFLPGAILFIGVALPVIGADVLLLQLSFGSVLVLLILSFGAGSAIQVIGSSVSSGSSRFSTHMPNVVTEEDHGGENHETVTKVDIRFWETCRSEFGFDADFSNWDRLFKSVLAELEETSRSRTLRLQALFLAYRGLMVSTALLALYYVLYVIGIETEVVAGAVGTPVLSILATVSALSAIAFFSRQKEFKSDVTQYMVNEYYLSKGRKYYEVDLDDGQGGENGE